MEKTTKTTKKTKRTEGGYSLKVFVNDAEYNSKGANMIEALTGFVENPVFPVGVKTRVVFNFSDGKRNGIFRYPVSVARRVFKMMVHKMSSREILASKMEGRLV